MLTLLGFWSGERTSGSSGRFLRARPAAEIVIAIALAVGIGPVRIWRDHRLVVLAAAFGFCEILRHLVMARLVAAGERMAFAGAH
jgi:hypothetical protein